MISTSENYCHFAASPRVGSWPRAKEHKSNPRINQRKDENNSRKPRRMDGLEHKLRDLEWKTDRNLKPPFLGGVLLFPSSSFSSSGEGGKRLINKNQIATSTDTTITSRDVFLSVSRV